MNKPDQTIEEILKPLRKYSISIAFEQELNIATQATSDLLIKARIDELESLFKKWSDHVEEVGEIISTPYYAITEQRLIGLKEKNHDK